MGRVYDFIESCKTCRVEIIGLQVKVKGVISLVLNPCLM